LLALLQSDFDRRNFVTPREVERWPRIRTVGIRTVGIRRSEEAQGLLPALVGRASRCLGRVLWVRPEWRCGVSFRMIKVLDQFGEKVPGEAR
jgi:hypothetical protein